MSQNLTGAENKALTLLGNSFPNHVVAMATGLSDSRISQLLSEDWFKNKVNELRYAALIKHNDLDGRYDNLENRLVEKLEGQIDLMFKPSEVTKTLQVINSLKRRGVSSPEHISTQQPALSLVMPTIILQNFVKSGNNQVVEVDDTPLVTIQPEQLQRMNHNGLPAPNSLAPPENGATKAIQGTEQKSPSLAELRKRLDSLRARQSESLQYSAEN